MSLFLYLVYMTDADKSYIDKTISSSSQSVQNKILKYHFAEDKRSLFLSDLLARKTLAQELKRNLDSITIERDDYGKPFLKEQTRHFNLSHSRNLIVLATDESPLGVDIEYVLPLDDLESLITFFSKEEQEKFFSMNEKQRLDYFYELWTLKESYVKAIGKGLNFSLESFTINVTKKEAFLSKGFNSSISWYFKRYMFHDSYRCAICAQHNVFPKSPVIVDIQDLLNL